MSEILCVGYLSLLSVLDIRTGKLPVWVLVFGAVASGIYQIVWGKQPIRMILSGAAVGLLFLLVSRVTREGLGYGDSILMGILGIYLGVQKLLSVLSVAFFLSAILAVMVLVLRKFRRKSAFPFVPFLCIGYISMLAMGGG